MDNQPENLLTPLRIIRHDKFDVEIFANDIALVRLEQSKNGKSIARSSISLVNHDTHQQVVKRYARVTIYGWGATQFNKKNDDTKQLLRIDIPQVDKVDCLEALDNSKNDAVKKRGARKNPVCRIFHRRDRDLQWRQWQWCSLFIDR